MKLLSADIKDILSIGHIAITFDSTGLVLLDGWNHDDGTANGAGKTSLFNAIAYGLYGKLPRKISSSEIVRRGAKTGSVSIVVDVDGIILSVTRERPNKLTFCIDGVEKEMTQEEFESKLKVNYSQFLISMYSAQTEALKLIALNDSGKKDFFLQLMNLDYFTDCKKSLDTTLKNLYSKKNAMDVEIAELTSKISTYDESIVDVASLQLKIQSIDLASLNDAIEQHQLVISPDTQKYDNLEDKLNQQLYATVEQLKTMNRQVEDLEEIDGQIDELKNSQDSMESQTCPNCGYITTVSEHGVCSADEIKTKINNKLTALTNKRTLLDASMSSTDELSDRETKLRDLLTRCRKKRKVELEEYNQNQRKIAELQQTIAVQTSKRDTYNLQIQQNQIITTKRKACVVKETTLQESLLLLNDDVALHESLAQIFSPTGAPAYILDSAIDVFNTKMANNIAVLWPNATYELQSFKENKSGDIRAKLSEKLVIAGNDTSIGALSGGEYRCLSLAIDFAVIDMLETMFGIQLTPIVLDEPFNGLDTSNRERALDLLEHIALSRQIIIIDHASEAKALFSKVMLIEKRGGVSYIA